MRRLNSVEIEALANGQGVRTIAVENFLSTMGDDTEEAERNLVIDAGLYDWNEATREAVQTGITLATLTDDPTCGDRRDLSFEEAREAATKNARKGRFRWSRWIIRRTSQGHFIHDGSIHGYEAWGPVVDVVKTEDVQEEDS